MVWMSPILALQKIRLLLAKKRCEIYGPKKRWEIYGPFLHKEKLFKSPQLIAFWNSPLSPSEHIKKKIGDKGSPCLISLAGWINPCGSPLTSTKYDTMLMHSMTKPNYLSWKPILDTSFYTRLINFSSQSQ